MKALSIRQPWAQQIADGQKTIETRTWPTNYRGPLLICASKTVDVVHLLEYELTYPRYRTFPLGQAVAYCVLRDCRPMVPSDEPKAACAYYDRAYAWVLEGVRKLKPFPVVGSLGIFEAPIVKGRLIYE